jgi:uncharacterized protein (TIGR02996 family)
LIYADWLAEHSEPDRAEFIHAQIVLTPAIQEALDRIA